MPLARTRHAGSHRLIGEHGIESLARSFGEQLPGALVTNNYPASMQDVSVPGVGVMDLGSVDLYRDRERGVPTFNQLRREIGLKPVASFDDLIDDPAWRPTCATSTAPTRRAATTSMTWTC